MTAFTYPHELLRTLSVAVARAETDLRAAEARAGRAFPHDAIHSMHARPRYESLEAVDGAVRDFVARAGDDALRGIESATGVDFDAVLDRIDLFKPFRVHIMPEFHAAPGGGLEAVPHFAPSHGAERYHSLSNAVYMGAAQATVFDGAIRSVPLYPGKEALDARLDGRDWPEPCGTAAEYRVTMLDGTICAPSLHPGDARRRSEAAIDETCEVTP